ncbi:pyrroline-5-carboxylate reductase, partial [Thioclava sp. BHET1]
MTLETVGRRGLVLLGCGKMGSAMLAGWLERGLAPGAVWVLDPHPSDWVTELAGQGLHLNDDLSAAPAI